jgi:GntR family transcriptional regulator of arabinose operon
VRSLAKYQQIAKDVRGMIESGKYAPGDKLPSERELAVLYKVNLATASKALSSLQVEGSIIREHGSGSFVKEQKKFSEVTFLAYDINQCCGEIMKGVEEVLSVNDCKLVVRCSNGNLRKEKEIVESIAVNNGALIIFPFIARNKSNSHLFRKLQKQNFPFVLVDRYYEDLECDYSGADNYSGSYDLTEYLINKGHSRIAHLMSPSQSSVVKERLNGYLGALQSHEIEIDNALIGKLPMAEDIKYKPLKEITSIVDAWLALPEPPTAITTTADGFSLFVMKILLAKRIRIPEDIALAGFDNSKFCTLSEIPLSSVDVELRQIGRNAANLLRYRVESRDFSDRRKSILPVKLIERQSTNPLVLNDKFDIADYESILELAK